MAEKTRWLADISSSNTFGPITPSDSWMGHSCRAIYVWTTGDLDVANEDWTKVTFVWVPAWSYVMVITDTVFESTTASDLVYLL